jgi:pimeloyl-ACP methyl ester carboxylesterase
LHHFRHPLFHRFGPGYRLIAVDRPGSGYSVRANGRSGSLIEQAQFVRRFIETIGLDRPLVVGHSLGAAVALATAIEHPGSISGIALIAPPTRMEPEIRREFAGLAIRSPMRRWAIANTIAIPASLKYAPQTLAFVFGPQTAGKDYIIEGGGYAGLRPSHFYATSTDFVALEDVLGRLEERYGEIDMPAGMIFGTEDRVLDYRIHGLPMSARIAGLDFELLDGMGHMLQFVAPDRTLAFIERVAARAFADRH